MPASPSPDRQRGAPRSLSGLLPFLRPYRGRIGFAALFLLLAAAATLVFPVALRQLIDGGLVNRALAAGASDMGREARVLSAL